MVRLLSVLHNFNAISLDKLCNILKVTSDPNCYDQYPSFILGLEPKTLQPPNVAGYTCLHNLSSAVGGACVYYKHNMELVEILVCDQNCILAVFKASTPFAVGAVYNQYSTKSLWRYHLASLLEKFSTFHGPAFLGFDFNYNLGSNQANELEFCLLNSRPNSISHDAIPTCRGSTKPDFYVGRDCFGACSTVNSQINSDHAILSCSLTIRLGLDSPARQPFSCVLRHDDHSSIDTLWSSIDIRLLSRQASSVSEFFLNLELKVRAFLMTHGFIRCVKSINDNIKSFIDSDIDLILNGPGCVPSKMRNISSWLNPGSTSVKFVDIKEALDVAESLPLDSSLSSVEKRLSSSPTTLSFKVSVAWEAIHSFSHSKSSGLSLLSVSILKRIPPVHLRVILDWFARVSKLRYPSIFRLHKVVGVPKGCGGVRPICILSSIAKLYDKILYLSLCPVLSGCLPPNQTAYLEQRRGCEENLFCLHVLSRKYSDLGLVLMDYAKAFNTVPNITIRRALSSCGISGTLLEAVMEALVKFRICDFSCLNTADYVRGVKQGGVTSGLIFTTVLIELSVLLDNLPLKLPIFLSGRRITHILFADDLVLVYRCLSDALLLSRTVEKWAYSVGMVLNPSKCVILNGLESNLLWYKACFSAKYLGVKITLKDGILSFSRPCTNSFFAYRLRPAVRKIKNPDLLKNLIRTFTSGPYAQQICFLDQLGTIRCGADFLEHTKTFDNYWKIIFRDFFNFPKNHFLSIPRLTSEFNLASARFGVTVINHAANFHYYLKNKIPKNSLAFIAFEAGFSSSAGLERAVALRKEFCFVKIRSHEISWLNSPARVRNRLAPILVSTLAREFLEFKPLLLSLIAKKRYTEVRILVEKLLKC